MHLMNRRFLVAAVVMTLSTAVIAVAADKPTVTCKDGTTAPGGRGACRGHGGVNTSAAKSQGASSGTAAAPAAAPQAAANSEKKSGGKAATNDPAGALAKCKDGMYWHGTKHSGACSHHQGVAEWMDGSK